MIKYKINPITGQPVPVVVDETSLANGQVPKAQDGKLVSSALTEGTTNVVMNKSIAVPPSTVYIGPVLSISESSHEAILTNSSVANSESFVVRTPFDYVNGSSPALTRWLGPVQTSSVKQPLFTQKSNDFVNPLWTNNTAGKVQTILDTGIFELYDTITIKQYFRFVDNATGVRVVVRLNNETGPAIFKSHTDEDFQAGIGYTVTGSASGSVVTAFNYKTAAVTRPQTLYHVTVENITNTVNMWGVFVPLFNGVQNQFAPFMALDGQPGTTFALVSRDNPILQGIAEGVATGSLSCTQGSTAVVGSGTLFTQELKVGDAIQIQERFYTVTAIASDTSLTIDQPSAYTQTIQPIKIDANLFEVRTAADKNKFTITKSGYVGINTTPNTSVLAVNGVIESQSGGVKYPDGTTQTTAYNPSSIVLPSFEQASTTTVTTTATTYSTLTGMSVGSLAAGKYLAKFSGLFTLASNNREMSVALHLNGTAITTSERGFNSSANGQKAEVSTTAIITVPANGTIDLRWRAVGTSTTVTATNRTLDLIKIG